MTAEPLDSSLFPDSLFLPCGCALCRPPAASEGAMGDGTGTQSLQPQFSVATVPSSAVLALLPSDVPRWGGGAVGSGATVTYSFMETAPSYAGSGDRLGFAVMSATQRAAVRLAVAAWSEVANINFVETSDSGNGGSIRFGTNRQRGVSAAYAYYPTGSPYDGGGDVYLANDSANNTNPTPGSYGFKTILHEIGHAIGLKHPGNYNAGGGGSEAPYLSSAEDNYRYTLMSYNDHPSLGLNGMVRSPALYDIAAVQHLYGANSLTRLGNDTYSYASPTTAFSASIWDAGGIDTIDAGGQTAAVTINLNGGSFSSIGTNGNRGAAVDNLSIAYGAVIENAIGGAGNDILLGNDADNALTGGAGGDSLTGGAGNDSLTGGPGTDTAVFSGNRADYTITADSGLAVITHNNGGSDGTDTLTGIEYALFADLRFNLQPPTVTGTNRTLTLGSAVAVSALLTATDPGGGSIVTYELIDGTANGGHLTVNGTEQASGGVVSVTAAALSTVTFVGAALGTDRITARVHNGTLWSGWTSLLVTTRPTNTAPTLQPDKALRFQESAPPTTLGVATPTDPDGDAMTVALTTLPGSGSIRRAGGATVTAGTTLTVADLAGLTYTPASGFAGEAGRFAYTVTDAQGNASRQTVTLTVDALSTLTTDFNPFVYLASNLDLADRFGLDGEAARAHYLQSGRFEGRATASFDAMAYLVQNTDVARAAGFDPTTAAAHYLTHGRFEGRGQSAFDALAYLAANPDLAVAFGTDTVQATRHYVTLGSAEGRRIAFDAYAYVAANPDLAAAFGVDRTAALRHYITLGRDEGRSTAFDALGYLAANPDLAAAFGTDIAGAERHYIALGRTEGRGTSFDVGGYLAANPQLRSAFNGDDTLALTYRILYDGRPRRDDAGFDPLTYLAANPDLAALYGTDTAAAQAHYDAHGRTEGRPTAFNGYAYLAGNPDLQAAFGGDETKALEHFIRLGRLELRPNPLGYTRPSNALAGAFAGSGTGASAFLGAAGAMPGFA